MITVGPDPYFYQQKAQQLGQSIGILLNALADRRQRREEREARELETTIRMMEQYPETAGKLAPVVRQRYGDRPDISALLDVFENRNRLRTDAEGAYTDYMRSVDAEDRRLGELQTVASGPNLLPGPLPIPNIPAIRAGVELMTMTPETPYMNAAFALSPSQLEQAHLGAKVLGMTPPPAIMTDPSRLPDSVYAGYVYDNLPGAAKEIVDNKLRELTSPEDRAERDHAVRLSKLTTNRQRESQAAIDRRQQAGREHADRFQKTQQENAVSLERLQHDLRRETSALIKAQQGSPEDKERARAYSRYIDQLTRMVVGVGETRQEKNADAAERISRGKEELEKALGSGADLADVWTSIVTDLRKTGRWK